LQLRLPFRQPLAPDNLFGHLAATAVHSVEEVRGETYRRTLGLAHGPGILELTPTPDHIRCRAVLTDLRDLTSAINRARRLLDLDADPVAIDTQLIADPVFRPLVAKAPGRRVPRCVDGAELAVRAVLGQQVSIATARAHAARLVEAAGEPVIDPGGSLSHLFPGPEAILQTDVALPGGRRRALDALCRSLDRHLDLGPGAARVEARRVLGGLPGIGDWTTETVAMRALGDPDAFPVTDLGVRRGASAIGLPTSPAALTRRAEGWRPWRAYAVQYLLASIEHPINRWPPPMGANHQRRARPAATTNPTPTMTDPKEEP
jgi:AraC family transcriptional regulator of adaptative response / DNA-3-methyladenine glycosylase II